MQRVICSRRRIVEENIARFYVSAYCKLLACLKKHAACAMNYRPEHEFITPFINSDMKAQDSLGLP